MRATARRFTADLTPMFAGPSTDAEGNHRPGHSDGSRPSTSAIHLRSHPEILSLGPLPPDLRPPFARGGRLVEAGCGTARNLLQIARRYPKVRLYSLDISGEMLRSAHETTRRTGLQVKLVQAGAEDLRPELFGQPENFDRIVFSYSLSMISKWDQVLNRAAAAFEASGAYSYRGFWRFDRARKDRQIPLEDMASPLPCFSAIRASADIRIGQKHC